jgi:hypothetical protein
MVNHDRIHAATILVGVHETTGARQWAANAPVEMLSHDHLDALGVPKMLSHISEETLKRIRAGLKGPFCASYLSLGERREIERERRTETRSTSNDYTFPVVLLSPNGSERKTFLGHGEVLTFTTGPFPVMTAHDQGRSRPSMIQAIRTYVQAGWKVEES